MLIWKLEFGTCRKLMNHVPVARNARHHIQQRIVTKYLLGVRDTYLLIEESVELFLFRVLGSNSKRDS